jgi:hypothetical protein
VATTNLVSVREYLNTSYRPDCDYIDGEVRERNWGELEHALLQTLLAGRLLANARDWNVSQSAIGLRVV